MTEIEPMDEARAREILGEFLHPDGRIGCSAPWLSWPAWGKNPEFLLIDGGTLTADQLEAIAWWMRAHA